jgi:hypothetical protein
MSGDRPQTPYTADDRRWDDEAVELQHTGLKAIRDAAAGWEKTIAGVLGAFSVVAFIKGPEGLKDIPGASKTQIDILFFKDIDVPRTAVLLIFAAALLLTSAIVLAAFAAQGSSKWYQILDGRTLQRQTRQAVRSAANQLRGSRILTSLAAMTVLSALALTWYADIDARDRASAPTQNAIVIADDVAMCGPISTASDGQLSVTTGGKTLTVTGARSLQFVESCP